MEHTVEFCSIVVQVSANKTIVTSIEFSRDQNAKKAKADLATILADLETNNWKLAHNPVGVSIPATNHSIILYVYKKKIE